MSDADAIALTRACDVVDLHLDTFIWARVFGYDPLVRHGQGLFGRRFYSRFLSCFLFCRQGTVQCRRSGCRFRKRCHNRV